MSTAESKSVTLGGVVYDVPPVPFKACAKILPLVDKTFLAVRENRLDEESIINLGRIVYLAITKPPELTEEAFLSLTVPLSEMVAAAVVVAQQANMKATTPGEATGVKSPQISTN